jgi:hypothetical protein
MKKTLLLIFLAFLNLFTTHATTIIDANSTPISLVYVNEFSYYLNDDCKIPTNTFDNAISLPIHESDLPAAKVSAQLEVTRDIFLVIGQSNTSGRALIEAQDQIVLTGVDLFNGTSWEPAANPMNGYSTIKNDNLYQGLNYSYNFGKFVNMYTNNQVGIVCNARGGTRISEWAKDTGEGYFEEAVRLTNAAVAAGGTLKGILWHQGEGDRNNSNYLTLLSALIADLRSELGNVPFIAGQLSQDRGDGNNDSFNSNIQGLPTLVSNTSVVLSDGLTTTDETHFDSTSQRTLGRRYAAKMLEMEYGFTINNLKIWVSEDANTAADTNSATNYGNETLVRVKYVGDTNSNTRNGFLKFNTDPSLTNIIDASLFVTGDVNSGTGIVSIGVYEANSSWNENTITHDNQPSSGDKINSITFRNGNTVTTTNIPIASYFENQFGTGNLSFVLKGDVSTAEQLRIYSKEDISNYDLRPYVLVQYLSSNSLSINTYSQEDVKTNKNDLIIYPNPGVNYINISSVTNISAIRIYDTKGTLIINKESINASAAFIDIAHIQSGIYFLKAIMSNGDIANKTIVK